MSRMHVLAALTAAALLATAGHAVAAATKATVKIKFATKKPKRPTGLEVTLKLGHDANGRYRILKRTQLTLPRGTKFDTAALTTCSFTEQQLLDGTGAEKMCPPSSKLGTGTADVIVGAGGSPLHFTGGVFNQRGKMILELTINGAPVYEITGTIKGNKIDFPLPGAEQLGTHPTQVTLDISRRGTARKPYLRTPVSCPTGRWSGSALTQYVGAVDNPKFTIACIKDAPKRARR